MARGDDAAPGSGHERLVLEAEASGRLDATGAEKVFSVQLPGTAKVTLDGPGGVDFDLYTRRDAPPTTSEFDQRAYTPGPDETLTNEPGTPGLYYVLARSYDGSGDFTLKVELE